MQLTKKLGDSILRDSYNEVMANTYGSFTEWTKGETELVDAVSVDLTDPYADCAGPYLTELMNRKQSVQKADAEGQIVFSDLIATELPLHERPKKTTKKAISQVNVRTRV